MLNVKKLFTKILKELRRPCVVAVDFSAPLTFQTTGTKHISAAVAVPDGYEVVPNCKPISLFVMGVFGVDITDRTNVEANGNTVSFWIYLYNPSATTGTMHIQASILCRKVGGVVICKLLTLFRASERRWAVC